MKSERLKKFELELQDLEDWLKLSLVPKKDLERHNREITLVKKKIQDEKNRLCNLEKTEQDLSYSIPRRNQSERQVYQDSPTIPGVDDDSVMTDAGFDLETESTTIAEGITVLEEDEDEQENPFSDRNRWKRGILEDPDSDNW